MDQDLRYPIGRFQRPAAVTAAERAAFIEAIAATPAALREAVRGLDDAQLDTPYRPDGWTVRQVVHHLADSHLNAYARLKLALTEMEPTIKPYDEAKWAALPDSRSPLVAESLALLDALHARWVFLLRAMTPADFGRTLVHPEHPGSPMTLDVLLAIYAWHGRHHVAHITALRERIGWP
ncbi:MAG TPA: putative metal-dependent hydrolase [Gemmatimonadaceae bacterium]|nr:putative metal-dependent hydrolase [Gemmatimonadaceae bacterium]